jgi:hypothetical protein
MILVSRSTTGQYVLTHPASHIVIVGDDLEASFERMRTLAAEHVPHAADGALDPTPGSAGDGVTPSRKRLLPWVALALLPFLWLGVLHLSLGRLVSELRAVPLPGPPAQELTELRARIDRLERRLEERPAIGARPHGIPVGVRRPTAPLDAESDDGDDADVPANPPASTTAGTNPAAAVDSDD